jgi:hypothetical protein
MDDTMGTMVQQSHLCNPNDNPTKIFHLKARREVETWLPNISTQKSGSTTSKQSFLPIKVTILPFNSMFFIVWEKSASERHDSTVDTWTYRKWCQIRFISNFQIGFRHFYWGVTDVVCHIWHLQSYLCQHVFSHFYFWIIYSLLVIIMQKYWYEH